MSDCMVQPNDVAFDLWEVFEEAYKFSGMDSSSRQLHCLNAESSDEEEDEWGQLQSEREFVQMRGRVCRLPDGDIHVCDSDCPYAVESVDSSGLGNGDWVCKYTGMVVKRCCEDRTDISTGRSTWSVDTDMHGGGVVGGKWYKKRDMKKESQAAYVMSRQLDDSVMPNAIEVPKAVRSNIKRGALCVDEVAPVDTAPKRIRVSKKDVRLSSTRNMLVEEAMITFCKLFGKYGVFVSTSVKRPILDARLLDFNILYPSAVKKYLKETASKGGRPCLDDIHNIALAVDNVIADEKRKIKKTALQRDVSSITGVRFRQQAASLAVALWTAACGTSYLNQPRRGNDSFRPFCAGVYYSFKRGLALSDGTVLVPKIDEFAKALPSSKVIAAETTLKSLHSSSHRGLCTIHRAIAAAGEANQAHSVFAEVIRAARSFT